MTTFFRSFLRGFLWGTIVGLVLLLGTLCDLAFSAEAPHPLDGVTLDSYSHAGVLVLTLNGACDFDVKLVEVYLKNAPAEVHQILEDTWTVITEETSGIFKAILCTEFQCIPVAIDFNTIPWDGLVPDLAPPSPSQLVPHEAVLPVAVLVTLVLLVYVWRRHVFK